MTVITFLMLSLMHKLTFIK